jgi:GTP-binding nuclear protein Ran
MSESFIKSFNVIILGDGGVGKTAFLTRHLTGDFEQQYNPTIEEKYIPLKFKTNIGDIQFNCCDTNGQGVYNDLNVDCYKNAQAAIIMFDVTSRLTYKNVEEYYNRIVNHCAKNIPIILCGNKVDCQDRKVKPSQIKFHIKKNINYYDVSSKSNYNFEKPFLDILRSLSNNSEVTFCE